MAEQKPRGHAASTVLNILLNFIWFEDFYLKKWRKNEFKFVQLKQIVFIFWKTSTTFTWLFRAKPHPCLFILVLSNLGHKKNKQTRIWLSQKGTWKRGTGNTLKLFTDIYNTCFAICSSSIIVVRSACKFSRGSRII